MPRQRQRSKHRFAGKWWTHGNRCCATERYAKERIYTLTATRTLHSATETALHPCIGPSFAQCIYDHFTNLLVYSANLILKNTGDYKSGVTILHIAPFRLFTNLGHEVKARLHMRFRLDFAYRTCPSGDEILPSYAFKYYVINFFPIHAMLSEKKNIRVRRVLYSKSHTKYHRKSHV